MADGVGEYFDGEKQEENLKVLKPPIVDSIFQERAVGIAATAGGGFAILEDALLAWGYWLREP